MAATFEEIKDWLESHQPKAELLPDEAEALQSLIGNKGLGALLSLMMAARHVSYITLAALPLGTDEMVARASVIQGTIKGIDLIRETLLEQTMPAQASEGAN